MHNSEIKNELLTTAWNTLNIVKSNYSGYFDTYTNIVINEYFEEITSGNLNNIKHISNAYSINNLIDTVTSDYMNNHNEINLQEMQSILIRLILDIILELQYDINFKDEYLDIQDISTDKVDEQLKLAMVQNNKKISNTLLLIGTRELMTREIGEKLDINITPMFNQEYMYILKTRELLDNKNDLLLKGDISKIFEKLGNTYKEDYLINTVNSYLKNTSLEQLKNLGLSEDDTNMLFSNLNINTKNLKKIEQEKEEEKAKEKLGLKDVNYVNADDTQYIKINNNIDDPIFAEVVGNITPQERLERIKDNNSLDIKKAEELTNEVKNDMITSGEFKDANPVINNQIKEDTNYSNLKVDTRTGLFINPNGEVYNLDPKNNRIQKLNNKGGIERGYNMKIDPRIEKKLDEYGIKEIYLKSTPPQRLVIEQQYGLNNPNQTHSNEKEKNGTQFVKKFDSKGYISSFIVVFSTGVLAGIISTILLNIGR